MSSTKKSQSFESLIERLDEIADTLDKGELSLKESLDTYEEAVKLFGMCEAQLAEANQRVRLLTKTEDGAVTDTPFDADDET